MTNPPRAVLEIICQQLYKQSVLEEATSFTPLYGPRAPLDITDAIRAMQRKNPMFRAATQSWTPECLARTLVETINEEKKLNNPHP